MKKKTGMLIFIYIGAWFVLNLLFLDTFPFMHSDESWLSGLSRAMMSSGPGVTEPFFDLFPRYPHAVKLLFHAVQMPFILAFGYNLFAVRLVSLLFAAATLFVFYRLCAHLFGSPLRALVMTAVLSLDIQFLYAAHLARQDIIITFFIVALVCFVVRRIERWSWKHDVAAGAVAGLAAGFHPGALMAALAVGALYVYYLFAKKLRLRNLGILVGTTALVAGVFVAVSYSFDSAFLAHYFQFGSTLGVGMSLGEKIATLPVYFYKLFAGISGTYYTPPVQAQLVLFGLAALGSAVLSFWRRDVLRRLLPLLGVLCGIVLIGRYSQPAVVLLFPLGWLLVFWLAHHLPRVMKTAALVVLAAAMLAVSLISVLPARNDDYRQYIAEVSDSVPAGSRVLSNLNTEYAFSEGVLLDVRNLQFLEENGLSFGDYIRSRDIEYIVYPEELDFIHHNRPAWDILYGDVSGYYEDMTAFLQNECTPVSSFTSPYAMRIVQYANVQPWTVTVYRVENGGTP